MHSEQWGACWDCRGLPRQMEWRLSAPQRCAMRCADACCVASIAAAALLIVVAGFCPGSACRHLSAWASTATLPAQAPRRRRRTGGERCGERGDRRRRPRCCCRYYTPAHRLCHCPNGSSSTELPPRMLKTQKRELAAPAPVCGECVRGQCTETHAPCRSIGERQQGKAACCATIS